MAEMVPCRKLAVNMFVVQLTHKVNVWDLHQVRQLRVPGSCSYMSAMLFTNASLTTPGCQNQQQNPDTCYC